MGLLVDGEWKTDWYESDDDGAFKRPPTRFRHQVEAGAETYKPEKDRYHLYVSYACAWPHRAVMSPPGLGLAGALFYTALESCFLVGLAWSRWSPSARSAVRRAG